MGVGRGAAGGSRGRVVGAAGGRPSGGNTGPRPRGGEGALQGVIDELMHRAGIAEAHFDLGRVHVHIHAKGVQLQEQHIGRMAAAVEDVGVGLADGVGDQLVAHEAAVHVKKLGVPVAAGVGRQGGEAVHPEQARFGLHRAGRGQEVVAEQGAHAGFAGARGQAVADAPVVGELQGHVGPGQGHAPEDIVAMGKFGALALQKLAPGRGVEIQVGHIHHAAVVEGGGGQLPRVGIDAPGVGGAVGAAGDAQTRDGGDGGQGFASEAHGADPLQIVQAGDLAGGVALQGQGQLILGDAAAIIGHPDAPHAALLKLHLDGGGAGVHGVFQHLLEHRSGALHHLAGGDLVDQVVRQQVDGHGGLPGRQGPHCTAGAARLLKKTAVARGRGAGLKTRSRPAVARPGRSC